MLPMTGVAGCGNWTLVQDNVNSRGGPLGRMGAQATKFALPSGEQALLFFGGAEFSGKFSSDLWKYEPIRDAWSLMPANSDGPVGRIHHTMLRLTHPDGIMHALIEYACHGVCAM